MGSSPIFRSNKSREQHKWFMQLIICLDSEDWCSRCAQKTENLLDLVRLQDLPSLFLSKPLKQAGGSVKPVPLGSSECDSLLRNFLLQQHSRLMHSADNREMVGSNPTCSTETHTAIILTQYVWVRIPICEQSRIAKWKRHLTYNQADTKYVKCLELNLKCGDGRTWGIGIIRNTEPLQGSVRGA